MNHAEFQQFIKNCYLFNAVAGKDVPKTRQDLRRQVKLIQEELNETNKAIMERNMEAALDGVVDVLVTALGLAQQLESLGCNLSGAAVATSENNLTKFLPTSTKDLSRVIAEEVAKFKEAGIEVTHRVDTERGFVVFKDANDKIRKPSFFVSNDLRDFVPSPVFKIK